MLINKIAVKRHSSHDFNPHIIFIPRTLYGKIPKSLLASRVYFNLHKRTIFLKVSRKLANVSNFVLLKLKKKCIRNI